MTINSNPPGAMVYVDEHQLGRTPISTDFTYYGTRNIRLELDNYQTLHIRQPVKPPVYQWPVLDFFAETFSPNEVKDQHTWTYNMVPQTVASQDQVLSRANQLRMEGSRSVDERGRPGAPVLREFYHNPRDSWTPPPAGPPEVPEASVISQDPTPAKTTAPIPETPSAETPQNTITESVFPPSGTFPPSVNETDTGPTINIPGEMPRGSESWDGPPRHPMQ
ncbi:MAG: PEGA domain-containing protein [Planctomycetia bacterium]|nr:PEGA domain-containing protein [Planctomycetia bacterium]